MNSTQHPFQRFQQDFADFLRAAQTPQTPKGIPERAAGVYRELVFTNLCGFVDACFPVCRALLGDERWRRLQRRFMQTQALQTPWFREIPAHFVDFLATHPGHLPRYLPELAHYEWLELAVDTMATSSPSVSPLGAAAATQIICLNPALVLAAYAWPVHRIGPAWRPRQAQASHLAVYRNTADEVCFSELNPLTFTLLNLLRAAEACDESLASVITSLAQAIAHPDSDKLLEHATGLLHDLQRQGIILGAKA